MFQILGKNANFAAAMVRSAERLNENAVKIGDSSRCCKFQLSYLWRVPKVLIIRH